MASARADALDSAAIIALTAGSDEPSAAQSRLPERRFPPPWTVDEIDACFIVRDRNEQALAYVCFKEEPRRRAAAGLLTRDEVRRIAVNIFAMLPDLLRRPRY